MDSKVFMIEEQLINKQREKGFVSRILAYTPELMMIECTYFRPGFIIPFHEHIHVQLSYVVEGSVNVTFADGTEKKCLAGDAIAFASSEAHSMETTSRKTVLINVFNPMMAEQLDSHKNIKQPTAQ